jgi:glyoxylase-like metal-dependent hydrolase (beta-lactamase superfamily II)
MYRVGRRQLLADLGRGTFAIAFLGGLTAACSSDESETSIDEPRASASAAETTTDDQPGVAPPSDPNELRWAQADLGAVSAYVLVRGNEAAVVDTGSAGSVEQIGAALATLGANFDDVRHVVLTHSHPDHIGSLSAVLERSAGAAAYAGEADIPNITSPVTVMSVGDGDDVFGLQVIDTPGHTPGSISVLDPGIGLLLAGDALTGNDDGSGLSGPDERFTSDMGTAYLSLEKLAGREVEVVGMGHGRPVLAGGGDALRRLVDELGIVSEDSSG